MMVRRGGRSMRGRAAKEEAARLKSARLSARAESVATIRIEGIAAGGDGVGRADGLACFVPRSAPGDLAQVALQMHARHARGRVLQLVEASASRVAPRCRHYEADRCGGCQLQHLDGDAQRDARLTIVQDALRRIGKREVPRATLVSGADWAYRGRLTLTLRRRGTSWIGGLHPFDDASRVFMLEECAIAHPSVVRAWHAVRAQSRGLPDAATLRVAIRRIGHVLRDGSNASTSDSGVIVLVVSGAFAWPDGSAWASALRKAHPDIVAVWWEREDGERELMDGPSPRYEGAGGGELEHDAQPDVETDAALMEPSAGIDGDGPEAAEALAFAQVNEEVAAALRAFVLEQVRTFSPSHVIDAYAGVGILSALLGASSSPQPTPLRVTAIEADPAGAAQARRRLRAFTTAHVVCDTVEHALAGALPADVVVLNPPRRGVDIQVTALLADAAARGLRAIVYVSCDPATLSRDVARLPAWRIAALRCFDMFPQTAHVESVCVLVPENG